MIAAGAAVLLVAACARDPGPGVPETFHWLTQPITFSPPPANWRREGENSGGLLGVRFVLTGGLGECITVAGYRQLAERGRRDAQAAQGYELTLAEALPHIRLRPERMQEPERWRIAYERDTTVAGHPAFASDDTLITPERPMLYRQIFWVVNGCPFQATYQGTKPNLPVFEKLVNTIQFPESARVALP